VYQNLKFCHIIEADARIKHIAKFKQKTRYFSVDINKVEGEAVKVMKTAIFPVTSLIESEDSENLRLDLLDPDFIGKVASETHQILDSLLEISQFTLTNSFPSPLILSFLAETSMPNTFQPSDFYTEYELSRLPFTTVGVLSSDLHPELSEMLIGGFLLIRVLVHRILFKTNLQFRAKAGDENFEKYLRLIGIIIYYAFKEIYDNLNPIIPDNLRIVTFTVPPEPLFDPLFYSIK